MPCSGSFGSDVEICLIVRGVVVIIAVAILSLIDLGNDPESVPVDLRRRIPLHTVNQFLVILWMISSFFALPRVLPVDQQQTIFKWK